MYEQNKSSDFIWTQAWIVLTLTTSHYLQNPWFNVMDD